MVLLTVVMSVKINTSLIEKLIGETFQTAMP